MGAIYRSEIPGPETYTLRASLATRRPPANVPYVVDNLWEWARPDEFPSRRHFVFASPLPESALDSWRTAGKIYKVELRGESIIAQVAVPDSIHHAECRSLRQLLRQFLGQAWFDASLEIKQDAGRLFVPCLTKQEIEQIFNTSSLRQVKSDVWRAVQYWQDAQLVQADEPWPFPNGEVFFVAEEWRLVDL